MVARCWPTGLMNLACSDNQCLRGCGVFLYWVPRVSIPLSLIWGTVSTFVYASQVSSIIGRVLATVIGTIAGALAFVAYCQTWRIGPGSPLDFAELVVTDPEAHAGVFRDGIPECMRDSVEAKHDGGVRFCSKCNCFKPDRAHHCRQCGVCVLRMDHHCPWFSTCIGFKNHKFFVQFLVYVWILCVCADLVALPLLINFFSNELYNTEYISVNFVIYLMLASVFNLVLVCFGGYSVYLAAANRTTLESMEPNAYKTSLPSNQWRYRQPPTRESLGNIYDVGVRANLEQILGTTWLEWLLPVQSRLQLAGISFPVNEDLKMKAEERAQTEISMHQRKRQWHINQQQQLQLA